MVTNGTAKYFIQDHLGSTTALTNSSGSVMESASYDSFGNATGNLSTRYQFTGREYDNFTGLHYYRARFYDAKLGRFISEDPIGFAGGDVNLFGYVGNNPLNFIAPSGTQRSAERWDKNEVERGREMQQYSPNPPKENRTCGCNKDVDDMQNFFRKRVDQMTRDGERVNNGPINNIISTIQLVALVTFPPLIPFGPFGNGSLYPLKGCGQQADVILDDLSSRKSNSIWNYEKVVVFTPLVHQYIVAKSNNPNDPTVTIDPWKNKFEVDKCGCEK